MRVGVVGPGAIAAGKLLVNLNNGVCAATRLGIAASLRDRDARWCFSRCILEGLEVMLAAGLRPARVTVLPPAMLARALLLPDAVVTRLAKGLASVHPSARSRDLDRGRATEIDDLNGAIVALASRAGRPAPANAAVAGAVHAHEAAVAEGRAPAFVAPSELRARMARAQ